MLNVFYIYALIWSMILTLYMLGWSDLCLTLNSDLLVFLIFSIICSVVIGKLFNVDKHISNTLKTTRRTLNEKLFRILLGIFVAFFAIEMILSQTVPIISVFLNGNTYTDAAIQPIPFIHMFISTVMILYGIYLSYMYVFAKNKIALYGVIIINVLQLVLMQRQYIFIGILLLINMIIYNMLHQKKKTHSKKPVFRFILIGACIIMTLFGFGVMGNTRYGDTWEWNDNSMIKMAGKINDKYPKFLYGFSWFYVYMVSPLANLNYNIEQENTAFDMVEYAKQYIPNFITNKIEKKDTKDSREPLLLSSALTVSTMYTDGYMSFNFLGIYLMFIIQTILCCVVIKITQKYSPDDLIIAASVLIYFAVMNMFDNAFRFSTTSLLVILIIVFVLRKKIIKMLSRSKSNKEH